jgi:hypothetical protein
MYNPVFLQSENELNKILKAQKRTGQHVSILFVSLWDQWCNDLVDTIKATALDEDKKLYIVNSFTMPHAFVIFNTTKLPHLLKLGRDKVRSEDYLPLVYKGLGL